MGRKPPADRKRADALQAALKRMFGKLESRPPPAHLTDLIDSLENCEREERPRRSGKN